MPIAEITRAQTSQRARLVHVHSYDVALDLTRGEEVFGSVSVVRFDCTEPGEASYIDLIADAVHEITLNGMPLDPAAAYADGRVTLPGLAASNELRVAADCAYARSGTGMHRSADSADGGIYIYGELAQAYARTAYACFDQPDLKAEFTFRVTAPAQWTVLSNQPAAGAPDPAGDGSAVWCFLPTPRLPTFTTTVVAGDYHVVTASHTTPSRQQIPLELACRAGPSCPISSRPWRPARARTWSRGRKRGWRLRDPTRCVANSAPTPAAPSPSSPSCRTHQDSTPPCGRTVSRSASTSVPEVR